MLFYEKLWSHFEYSWTGKLDDLYIKSKAPIISAIEEGVKIFDKLKRTCLRTDWSRTSIGFWLMQKHCGCKKQSLGVVLMADILLWLALSSLSLLSAIILLEKERR